jgi:phosphogluconate dehydratase
MNPTVEAVTAELAARSRKSREAYLDMCRRTQDQEPPRQTLSCGNLAHGYAACSDDEKALIGGMEAVNIGIISAYNDMLSAHQPLAEYPQRLKDIVRRLGGTAQVASGVPAMCDGVTQGQPGMDLSLFSRDVVAMATAVGLSHNIFDAAVCLGICDKIVPGMMIGSLQFGHLPIAFLGSGPMGSGIPNKEKAAVRQQYAEGKASRDELLAVESASYHSPGTCTFYGTANSNQVLMEMLGVQLPGSSFLHPDDPLRGALNESLMQALMQATAKNRYRPLYEVVTEKTLVNAVVALLATGGSTNHTLHLIAIARAAGIDLTWEDMDRLSAAVPLLARIYPNGSADINDFQQAGGMAFLVRELRAGGLLNEDIRTVIGDGLDAYCAAPEQDGGGAAAWQTPVLKSSRHDVLRGVGEPFQNEGGLRRLMGNLGESVIKVSAVVPEHHQVRAACRIFESQDAMRDAFEAGELDRDVVVVVRFQGPAANGMPELHKLTPFLGVLQDRGFKVALVTDGRMSGASGKVPAAIHLTPEAINEGPISRLRDGDVIALDAAAGSLSVEVDESEFASRAPAAPPPAATTLGRGLFAAFRSGASGAGAGASVFEPGWAEREGTATSERKRKDSHERGETAMSDDFDGALKRARVLPVVTPPAPEATVHLAEALAEGGMTAIEITLRSETALESIAAVKAALPGMTVAAGTITNAAQYADAVAAGADFCVSPGLTRELLEATRDAAVRLLPGVATASEIMLGLEYGLDRFKLFPAVPVGGIPLLKSFAGPFPQVRFCPTGGLTPANFQDFLALPNVICCGGSWMVASSLIKTGQWQEITRLARHAMQP